jgi:hypothetical protein
VPSGLGHLHGHGACGCVDPLGLVAVGIALAGLRALVEARAEEAFPLDLHRQLEGAAKDRGDVAGPVLDQMFQDRLNRRILPSVHLLVSMGVLQLHGISEWAAPAGACPSRGSWAQPQANFQTSGYSTGLEPPSDKSQIVFNCSLRFVSLE